jgi:hypothetical protein
VVNKSKVKKRRLERWRVHIESNGQTSGGVLRIKLTLNTVCAERYNLRWHSETKHSDINQNYSGHFRKQAASLLQTLKHLYKKNWFSRISFRNEFWYSLTLWCRICFEKWILTQIVKPEPAFFMEPESSLSCSQKPTNGAYSEPAESGSSHRYISP